MLARLMLAAAAGNLDSLVIDAIDAHDFESQPVDVLHASLPLVTDSLQAELAAR